MGKIQVPSIGRIVHYVSYGTPGGEYIPEHRAAIVTEVYYDTHNPDEPVGLYVMNPTGVFHNVRVKHDEIDKKGGTWHWPEYVEARETEA